MKTTVFVIFSILVILAGFSIAIVEYNNHKVTKAAAVNSAVEQANATLKLHDQVNATNLANATVQITTLNTQKTTLCTQIKGAKLVQPLCP